jgi:Tfp pilus assembly protein FimT
LGLSHYQKWQDQKALSQSLDILSAQIELAHSLNLTRGEPIYLCASLDSINCSTEWQGPLIVFASTHPPHIEHIFSQQSLSGTTEITDIHHFYSKQAYLRFMSAGEMVYNGNIELTNHQEKRCLSLSRTAVTKEIPCQNQVVAG